MTSFVFLVGRKLGVLPKKEKIHTSVNIFFTSFHQTALILVGDILDEVSKLLDTNYATLSKSFNLPELQFILL